MHQDSFKTKPRTQEYVDNYNQIDWSKPLHKKDKPKKEVIEPTYDYSNCETIDIEEWLQEKVKEGL